MARARSLALLLALLALGTGARAADTDADGVDDAFDNCPLTANPDQLDRGGIGTSAADGAGDACQNGDWNQDGKVDVLDTTLVRRALAGAPPPLDPHLPPQVSSQCPVGFCDSDGDPSDGCEDPLDDNPACLAAISLGSIVGDASGSSVTLTGRGEVERTVLVQESNLVQVAPIRARVTLASPANANYDLFVHCGSAGCSGDPVGSTNPGSAIDSVDLARSDVAGDQSYLVIIEVRWIGGTGCGSWTLTVTGDAGTANNNCGP